MAIDTYRKALQSIINTDENEMKATLHNDIGIVENKLTHFKLALESFNESRKLNEKERRELSG